MLPTIKEVRDSYCELVSFRRPGRSDTEEEFIERYIDPLGCLKDEFGNRYIRIGFDPVMWSCHTDTVHYNEGTQVVAVTSENIVSVGAQSKVNSNCLGADCTTGVWIMIEMIKAKKPGLYIFHRDEESGGQGSTWIAHNTPELVKDIKFAIAFDRYGTTSIITNQMGRCCSDDFADSMIEQMPGFKKDPNGIFTDTAFYVDLIPECTNVSVGYRGHHSSSEIQDLNHLRHLLDLMLKLDISKLRASRDPKAPRTNGRTRTHWSDYMEDENMYGYGGFEEYGYAHKSERNQNLEEATLLTLVKANPHAAVGLMTLYGITAQELMEHAFEDTRGYGT